MKTLMGIIALIIYFGAIGFIGYILIKEED